MTHTVCASDCPSCACEGPVRSRIRWWRELALLGLLYAFYMAARGFMSVNSGDAEERGQQILDLEAALFLDIEGPLNDLVTALPTLGLLSAYLYATLHYLVTPAVLVWVAWRRSESYGRLRTALLIATALGLVGYWLLPTAPPRLLGTGLTDTMALWSGSGWWGEAASAPRGMEGLSNQYAAMPSLHVGWAVWVAYALREQAGSARVRRWAWTYPAVMTFIVMATANHYLLDAVAGYAVVAAGVVLARRWASRAERREALTAAGARAETVLVAPATQGARTAHAAAGPRPHGELALCATCG